jgi:hypothetical protein
MSAVRNILSDLVDRRLWPVALALVAALVAVPVMLGGGPTASSTPSSAAPIANAGTAGGTVQAAISVSQPSTARHDRPGAVRNPFVQHKVPGIQDATSNVTQPSSAPAPAVSAPSSPIVGGTPSAPLAPIIPGGGKVVQDVWRVNLRFGEAGNQKVHHNIPRLTPLPSTTNPFFVFLGVLADHKTAVFLISSDATATGDGKCKPNPTQCDTIELRAGDTEFFDVAQGNAGVVQYELDLVKITHSKVTGTAAAAKASRQVSTGGKDVVQELKAEGDTSMGRYIYSYKRGVLVRRHGVRIKAAASSNSTAMETGAHSSGLLGDNWGADAQ